MLDKKERGCSGGKEKSKEKILRYEMMTRMMGKLNDAIRPVVGKF